VLDTYKTPKRRVRLTDPPPRYDFLLVRMRGLEPPRCHHHRLLRPARLPVPPHPQGTGRYYANGFRRCQPRKSCVARGLLYGFVDTRAHWRRKSQRALNTEGKRGERSCSWVFRFLEPAPSEVAIAPSSASFEAIVVAVAAPSSLETIIVAIAARTSKDAS
jgi:hypothetical protein